MVFVRVHVFAIATLVFLSAGCSRRAEPVTGAWATTATDGNIARYGPATLYVRFPENAAGRTQPLITSGKPEEADGLFVRYVAKGVIRFGYDHWGAPVCESEDIAVTPGEIHAISVSMPSLLARSVRGKRTPLKEVLVVKLNGQLVWRRNVLHHPAPAESIHIGRNRGLLASCEPEFSGVIALVEREAASDETWTPAGGAMIELEVVFPAAPRTGVSEPLVSYGVTGAADLLLVEYHAGKRICFGLDHWSTPLQRSEPLEISDGVQRIQVAFDRKAARDQQGVTVWLNGTQVWRAKAPLYPATNETLEICANTVEASSCERSFSGALVGLRFLESK